MKLARSSGRVAANKAWNFDRSRSRKASTGGRIAVTGAPGAGSLVRAATGSPALGANVAGRRSWNVLHWYT
jgi:hypothetical protein